ncbi:MAG TPA: helix-turn-helix domain-containing protein [Actinomycetota bacterium]|nr:helix-turn-helix domain-containing protein [Actinomycetota bacterium]
MPETRDLEVHKALADDTRYRMYRYIGLAGRPVSVREMSRRLSLHPNTLRPHLRRLEEAGLMSREIRKTASVGRPQTMYSIRDTEGPEGRDYRLLAEMLCGIVRGQPALQQARELARQWGAYLVAQGGPKPGIKLPARRNLAVLQEAMAKAGFQPRFRREGQAAIEITLRDCPFRDLADDYRELVCTLHRGLLEGMVAGLNPELSIKEFRPFAERGICRVNAG